MPTRGDGVRRVAPDRFPDAAEDVSRQVRFSSENVRNGSVTGPAVPSLGPICRLGQGEGDPLARVVVRADREHDVLLAIVQVGHRRPRGAGCQLCLPQHDA